MFDAGAGCATRRARRTGHDQSPHACAVRAERFEQFEHARVVGLVLAHECERDHRREVPVARGHGIGIALIPRWAVFEGDRLHVLELEGHSLVREVSIIYLKRHTSAVRVFVEFSRQFRKFGKT